MQKKKQSSPARSGRRGSSRSVDGSSVLAELAGRYARFRREHPRGARIPSDLRASTLAALEKGVAASELYRSCGVSWSQVVTWQLGHRSSADQAAKGDVEPAVVRAFSVADGHDGGAPVLSVSHELELRLGCWSITVRLAESDRTEGDGACFR